MSWYDRSRAVIDRVHKSIPADATLAQRRKAIQDAYPFGSRENFPYKAWCKAQREYLAKFDTRPVTHGLFAPLPETEGKG